MRLEIITGIMGSTRRWRTMPWLVMLFGIMIVPLGAISIFFIIIQPILLGTWCTLCLIAAAAMLIQIPYSLDELVATSEFLYRRKKQGRPLLRILFTGDTDEGSAEKTEHSEFERPVGAIIKDLVGGA
ncbi:vitamin K epoxide reductase family protein [Paraglaciecola sp. Hal342]